MIRILFVLSLFVLASCGPSAEEKINIAAIACSIMGETRNMDGAIRIREMNDVRVKIGGEPFLRGDDTIKESFEWGLCQELVLNENYDEILQPLKDAKRERERIAAEKRAEEKRVAEEKRAEENRIAAEKQRIVAEKKRIAESKPTIAEAFYNSGILKSRTNYQPKVDGGKRHGLHEEFHDNGPLASKVNYKDGLKEGLSKGYYDNGQLKWVSNWKNGVMFGLYESYYEGKVDIKQCYKNGDRVDMSYCEK